MAPSPEVIRNVTIASFILGFSVASFRLYLRWRKRLWWYDDAVALLSSLSFVFYVIGMILIANGVLSQGNKIVGSYFAIIGYHTPVWSARISIVLTVVRITPSQFRMKRLLLLIVALFTLAFAILTAQIYWVCEITDPAWKRIPGALCRFPVVVPIFQVTAAVISDAILVAMPLIIMRGVHVPALRLRLFSIFSVSVITTIGSLVHTVVTLVKPGPWQLIAGTAEAAVSIIVCNMSVIIPAVLRVLGAGDPFIREDSLELDLSSIDIAPVTSLGIEPNLTETGSTVVGDSDKIKGSLHSGDHDTRSAQRRKKAEDTHLSHFPGEVHSGVLT